MIRYISLLILTVANLMVSFAQLTSPVMPEDPKDNVEKQLVTYYYDFDSTKIRARGYLSGSGFSDLGKKLGEWEFYYENGKLQERANYVRGYVHGKVTQFYENGKRKNLGFFYWGVQDSIFKSWNPEGELIEAGTWEHGKKTGKWTYKYYDGSDYMVEKYVEGDSIPLLLEYHDGEGNHTVKNGTGFKKEFSRLGKLREEANYKDGYLHGKITEYHANGKVALEGQYNVGKRTDEWNYYYLTGTNIKSANFKNDLLDGPYTRSYRNGQVQVKGNYKEGLKTGVWEWFARNGAKDIKGEFVADKRHGVWKQWHLNGQLASEGTFANDNREGMWENWYENGQLEATGNYLNDMKDGEWKYYFETGELWKVGPFKDDKRHGHWITYFESGKKLNEGDFVDGKEHGLWKSWYQSGQLMDEGSFDMGKMHGEWKGWYPNGNLRYQGTRQNDLETGEWTYYFEDGSIYQQGSYKIFKRKNALGEIYTDMEYDEYEYARKHGEWKTYSEKDKKLTSVGSFEAGKQNGVWKYYHPGGEVVALEASYKTGKLHGKTVEYYWNRGHQVRSEINYKEGLKHGDMKVYDKRGRLIHHSVYKNGLLEKDIINKRKYKYKWNKQ